MYYKFWLWLWLRWSVTWWYRFFHFVTALAVAAAALIWFHRRDLASWWLRGFYNLDIVIRGAAQIRVDWRPAPGPEESGAVS